MRIAYEKFECGEYLEVMPNLFVLFHYYTDDGNVDLQ